MAEDLARRPDLLVVGGGLGATTLVAAMRRAGWDGTITVLAAETLMPYDRPPLSKELFTREQPSELAPQFGLAADAAAWLLGHTATAVESGPGGVTVTARTPDGSTEQFVAPRLVVAVGARPWAPPEWHGVRTLSTWHDAAALRERLTPGTSLIIVGAGWIGLEIASAASARGVGIRLVELTGRPLGAVLPQQVTDRIAHWVADAGIHSLAGGRVVGTTATSVTFEDGHTERADVVLSATGTRPATTWMPASWLDSTGHVMVNARAEAVMAEGVWAIGDCAAVNGISDQHWNEAVASAERCAHALLGIDVPEAHPPLVFSTMFGHELNLLGQARLDSAVVWRGPDQPGWTALLVNEGMLFAGVTVDRPRDVAGLRRAMRRPRPLIDLEVAVDASRPLGDAVGRPHRPAH